MESLLYTSADGYRLQKTLQKPIEFSGITLHCGHYTRVRLIPAPPQTGIVFERKDAIPHAPIQAHYSSVVSTDLATNLGNSKDPAQTIGTVEHLMAALYAMGVTNVVIEVYGPEIPILDGSAAPFIEKILEAGIVLQPYTNAVYESLKR